jgi:hypothetical protein
MAGPVGLRTLAFVALATVSSILTSVEASAQTGPHTRVGRNNVTAVLTQPRFIVEAVRFKAVDESGPNSPGADEVVAWFESGDHAVFSQEFDGVDTNETVTFGERERCIYPLADSDGRENRAWDCAAGGGGGPISFTVILAEIDPDYVFWAGFCFELGPIRSDVFVRSDTINCHVTEGDWDTLFRHDFSYSVSEILARLDPSCRCFTETARYTEEDWRGDTVYDFTFRITRVDGGGGPPVLDADPDGLNQPVQSSGMLTATTNRGFEFDGGTVVGPAGADFAFQRTGNTFFLTSSGGAKIWAGGSTARGYATCFAQRMSANYVSGQVNVPPAGSYSCYVTSDGRVGEFRVDSLTPGALGGGGTLVVTYTIWL